MKNVLKRSIALLLSLMLLLPVSVFAEELPETEPAVQAEAAQEAPAREEKRAEETAEKAEPEEKTETPAFAEEPEEKAETTAPAEEPQDQTGKEEKPAADETAEEPEEEPIPEEPAEEKPEEEPLPEEPAEEESEEEPLPEETEEEPEEEPTEEEILSLELEGEGENYVASGTFGDKITWTLDEQGVLVLTGTGPMPKGDAPWYDWKKDITSVVIGSGITAVGESNFFNYYSMVSLSLPETLTTIETSGFIKCGKLASLEIPASVTSIGPTAFEACDGLKSITVASGNSVYGAAGNCLFEKSTKTMIAGCKNSVIPTDGSVTKIGNRVFYWCTTLTSIRIPKAVTEIGDEAFMNCENLASLVIEENMTNIGENAFRNDAALSRVVLSPGLQRVDSLAFANCRAITEVYFTGLEDEWSSVFIKDGNDCLTDATVYYDWSETHGKCTGKGRAGALRWLVHEDGALTFKGNGTIADYNAGQAPWVKQYGSDIRSIDIPEGVTSIGKFAFYLLTHAASVKIGPSVTYIGERAFGETPISAIDIPASVNRIDRSALNGLDSLASITVDPKNTDFAAKDNCLIEKSTKSLIAGCKNSVIPADGSVTKIAYQAFQRCKGLTSVFIPSSVTEIEDSAFDSCEVKTVRLSEGLLKIGMNAFSNSGLTSVRIPSSVTGIGYKAFAGCSDLTSVKILSSDTVIGDSVFDTCKALTSVEFPSGMTGFGKSVFRNCENLADVKLPSGMTGISEAMFANCAGLKTLTIPKTVTSVGANAFALCNALTDVYYHGSREDQSGISVEQGNDCLTNATFHFDWSESHGGSAAADDFGNGVSWILYEDGALMLKGSGDAPGFDRGEAPWAADAVKSVTVEAGITGIGSNAFCGVALERAEFTGSDEQLDALLKNVGPGNESFLAVIRQHGVSVSFDREYVVIEADETVELNVSVFPENAEVAWAIDNGSAAVFGNGNVCTVLGRAQGRAYVTATVTANGKSVSARCRVDVTDVTKAIEDVTLADKKATVNLFSTDYAKVGIVLGLPQNKALTGYLPAPESPEGKGVTVKGAAFADEAVRELFDLVPTDDRTLMIVPKQDKLTEAQGDPKVFGKKYASAVTVYLDEAKSVSMTTAETLAVTVSQKLPKLTAKAVTLNLCYPSDIRPVTITGGTVRSLTFDWATAEWAELCPGGVRLKAGSVPEKPASAKLYCYAELEGWLYEFPVPVNVKAVKAVPAMTVKVTGAIDTAIQNSPAKVAITLKNASAAYAPRYELSVSDAEGTDVTEKFTVSAEEKGYTLTANASDMPAAGTYALLVRAFTDEDGKADVEKTVRLTVKASDPKKIKVTFSAKASGFIDPRLPESAVTLTTVFKNDYSYEPDSEKDLNFFWMEGKFPHNLNEEENPFDVTVSDGAFVIRAKPGMLDSTKKYAVRFCAKVGGTEFAKMINIQVKKGKINLAADVKTPILFAKDKNSEAFFSIPGITEMTEGTRVEIAPKQAALFTLRDLGGGQYALGHHGYAKTGTVTLNVFAAGNATTKPDAAVKIKVTVK